MYFPMILTTLLAFAGPASAWTVGKHPRGLLGTDPTATIGIGQIVGVQTSLPQASSAVNKFLGVPFADSPVRFARPSPARPLTRPLKTQRWKAGCIQQFNDPAIVRTFISGVYATPPEPESEDCLYLNVYAPATYGANRSVYFWIPAGEMQFGNAGQPAYDGSAFAAYHDIIVVTANFRTSVFGIPTSPQLNGTDGNLALLDQRLALQWIQDNIVQFGGDPKKVTVGGVVNAPLLTLPGPVSSGAWNAEILMYTYTPENAPFRAIITQSGNSAYLPYPVNPSSEGWDNLTATLGCGDYQDKVACMRTKDAKDIRKVVDTDKLDFFLALDNVTLPYSPYQDIKNNRFVHVPILTGTSAQEGRFYAVGQKNITSFLYDLAKTTPEIEKNIPDILRAYPVGGKYKNDYEALSALLTDYLFACPTALLTNNWQKQGAQVHQYLYNASFPNTAFSPHSGVYHASEVRIVFQTYNGGPVNGLAIPQGLLQTELPATREERELSSYINSVWAKFINDPQGGPGWDTYRSTGKPLVAVLGNQADTYEYTDRDALTLHCNVFLDLYSAGSPGVPKLYPADYQ